MMPEKTYSIYWAGALFDFKELCGNAAVALAVKKLSEEKYFPVLPQNSENNATRATDIRDSDLEMVFNSDFIVANFDGTELDSGTVVEFMVAKMLDIPAVLLRTDFRRAGDQSKGGNPWNLMCSGYPRTEVLTINAMALYHELRKQGKPLESMYEDIAGKTISALDRVLAEKPVRAGASSGEMLEIYRNVAEHCGKTFRKRMTDSRLLEILSEKTRKKLF